jgi:hypothetical protein
MGNPRVWGPYGWKVYLRFLWELQFSGYPSSYVPLNKVKRWVEIFLSLSPCDSCAIHGSLWFQSHAFPEITSGLFPYAVKFRNYVNTEQTKTPERLYQDVVAEYKDRDAKLSYQQKQAEWWNAFYAYLYHVSMYVMNITLGDEKKFAHYQKYTREFLLLTCELIPTSLLSSKDQAAWKTYLTQFPVSKQNQTVTQVDYMMYKNQEFYGLHHEEQMQIRKKTLSDDEKNKLRAKWIQDQKDFDKKNKSEIQNMILKGVDFKMELYDLFKYTLQMHTDLSLPGTCQLAQRYKQEAYALQSQIAKKELMEKGLQKSIPPELVLKTMDGKTFPLQPDAEMSKKKIEEQQEMIDFVAFLIFSILIAIIIISIVRARYFSNSIVPYASFVQNQTKI